MIGIDIIKIDRVTHSISKFGNKFKNRFMTSNEQKWATKDETIAGIWATKEAFSKALGTGIGKEFAFLDIEIYKNAKNKPNIKILNKNLANNLKNKQIDVSITHDAGFAISAVIIL